MNPVQFREEMVYVNLVNSFSQEIFLLSKVGSPTFHKLASSQQVSPSCLIPGRLCVHVCVCVCGV